MKIALIGPVYPYRGGIAHYTAMLAGALAERQHPTLVISFRRQYPSWLYPGTSDKDPSSQPLQVPAEYLLDPLYPWTWLQAARRIARYRPDRVAIQWWTTFWGLPFAFLSSYLGRRGFPTTYMIHNVLPHEQRPWDTWLARLALRQAQSFIVQTPQEEQRLKALIPQAVYQLCPLPVYSELSRRRLSKDQARRALKLAQDRPVLLFFGIVRPYKGLSVLLQALSKLGEAGYKPLLLVAGEFWQDKAAYQEQIERLDLDSQVRIDDRYIPDEEMALVFSAADALVAPYIAGTQSAAASLGLGFGLPLIVTDKVAAGIAEPYRSALRVVPAEDVAALAAAMQDFLEHPGGEPAPSSGGEDGWQRLIQALQSFQQASRNSGDP